MDDSGSAESADEGASAALAAILQNMQGTVPPPPAVDMALLAALTNYVLGQLGTAALTADQTQELTTLATKYNGQSLQYVAGRELRFSIQSWQTLAARQQARAVRATGPTLAALAGVDDTDVIRGEVSMGSTGTNAGGRTILWTSALAGCVGVAIGNAGTSFLAHFTPDQLNANGNPSPLDNTVDGINQAVPLNGASFWMSSPARNVQYYNGLRQRLLNAGAQLVAEYSSDTLALRTTDSTVFQNFNPPG